MPGEPPAAQHRPAGFLEASFEPGPSACQRARLTAATDAWFVGRATGPKPCMRPTKREPDSGRGYPRRVHPDQPPVYAGAGWRSVLASRLAAHARVQRHARFFALTGADRGSTIVDLGCGSAGLPALAREYDIVGVDLEDRPEYGRPVVVADVTRQLPFGDKQFDLAYSNSLLEHLAPPVRPAFAAEVKRIARGWFIQTPAASFPVEPHSLLPCVHWLPRPLRRRVWTFGVGGDVDQTWVVRRRELAALFDAPIHAERWFGLTKSWISVRPIAGSAGLR